MTKPTQAQIRKENGQILKRLTDKFGDELIDKILGAVKSEYREAFASGQEALALHEEKIVSRAKHLMAMDALTDKMKLAKAPKVKKLDPEIQKKNLAETEAFQKLLDKEFPQEIVEEIKTHIPDVIRDEITLGEIAMTKHMDIIVRKCEALRRKRKSQAVRKLIPNTVGRLPAPEQLAKELEAGKIEEYRSYSKVKDLDQIATGVYFFKSDDQRYVIKLFDEPVKELFATRLLSLGGVKTPDMRVIPRESEMGKVIVQKIYAFASQAEEEISKVQPTYYIIMTEIAGTSGEFLSSGVIHNSLDADENSIDMVFEGLGEMGAFDLLLYYRDRFSHIGPTNPHNYIIMKEGQTFTGVAGIDQLATLEMKKPSKIIYVDPFDEVLEMASEIMVHGEKISKGSIALWYGLPKQLKESLDRNRSLFACQRGLVKGLITLSEFTKEDIQNLYDEVVQYGTDPNVIDIAAYLKMLTRIQKAVREVGF